jgi:hypothetical protein
MYDYCIGLCEYDCFVTSFFFWIVDCLGLAAPEWFFSLVQKVYTSSPKYLCSLYFAFNIGILVDYTHTHTHTWVLIFHTVMTPFCKKQKIGRHKHNYLILGALHNWLICYGPYAPNRELPCGRCDRRTITLLHKHASQSFQGSIAIDHEAFIFRRKCENRCRQ